MITTSERCDDPLGDLGDQQRGGRSRPAPARSAAIALTNAGSISAADVRSTLARTSRSATSRSTRSPAREASAASSRAASIAWSSFGWSPTRPAEVRPESSTISTCRSRSGRQVRTTTVVERAVPRQSMERTSSPGTYSRRLSNSVPWPRCRMRRPAVELAQPGQPAGQVLAGVERRQRPDRPRRAVLGLPAGHPQRPERPDDHRPGGPVAAPGRHQGQVEPPALPGRDGHRAAPRRARRPTASRRCGRCRAASGGRCW